MEGVTKNNYDGEIYTGDYAWVNEEAEKRLRDAIWSMYGKPKTRDSGLCGVSILTPYKYIEPSYYGLQIKRKEKGNA